MIVNILLRTRMFYHVDNAGKLAVEFEDVSLKIRNLPLCKTESSLTSSVFLTAAYMYMYVSMISAGLSKVRQFYLCHTSQYILK